MSNLSIALMVCAAALVLVLIAHGVRIYARTNARKRCVAHLAHARRLMANGVYAGDKHGAAGPAELLGEVYRLQLTYGIAAKDVGLADDVELDLLISEVIDRQGPLETAPSPAIVDDGVSLPRYALDGEDVADDDRPTVPDMPAASAPDAKRAKACYTEPDTVDEILTSALNLASQPPGPPDGN